MLLQTLPGSERLLFTYSIYLFKHDGTYFICFSIILFQPNNACFNYFSNSFVFIQKTFTKLNVNKSREFRAEDRTQISFVEQKRL